MDCVQDALATDTKLNTVDGTWANLKKATYLDMLHRIPAYTMQVYCQQKLEAKLQSLHKNFAGDVSTSCLSALHLRTCCHTQCTKNIELLCWMNLVLLQDANYDFIM